MSENPLVSLIVPCYNIANVCDRFFESLLRQAYTNIQLILVDDGSTDNTKEKLFSFKSKLEEKGYIFEYYFQENKGLGGAINTGLKKIKGEYFCWADSDDYYEDNAFEIRVNYFLKHDECMILTCDAYERNSDDISNILSLESKYCHYHNDPNQFKHLLDYNSMFCAGAHMIRTEAFRRVNPLMDIYEARRGQNWQILMPMYYSYERDCLNIPIYNVIIYDASMSRNDKSYEQKLKRLEENATIQIETLNRMIMPEEEKEKYLSYINFFHLKEKMYNARQYKKVNEFNCYFNLCKKNGKLDLMDYLRVIFFLLFRK